MVPFAFNSTHVVGAPDAVSDQDYTCLGCAETMQIVKSATTGCSFVHLTDSEECKYAQKYVRSMVCLKTPTHLDCKGLYKYKNTIFVGAHGETYAAPVRVPMPSGKDLTVDGAALMFHEVPAHPLYQVQNAYAPGVSLGAMTILEELTPRTVVSAAVLDKAERDDLVQGRPLEGDTWISAPDGDNTALLLDIAQSQPQVHFLLVSMSESLQTIAKRGVRKKRLQNVLCHTYDSLVLSHFNAMRENKYNVVPLTDKSLILSIYPKMNPWYSNPGTSDSARIVECILSKSVKKLCPRHMQRKIGRKFVPCLQALNPYTQAGARARVADNPAVDIIGPQYDCLLLNGYHEMCPTVLEVLNRRGLPRVIVGSPEQTLQPIANCKCKLRRATTDAPRGSIRLYKSTRVPDTTLAYMMGNRPNLTCSDSREKGSVRFIPLTEVCARLTSQTVLLVQSDTDVCKWILRHPTLRVMGGSNVELHVEALRRLRVQTSSSQFHDYVLSLEEEKYGQLKELLHARDATDVDKESAVVSTIHSFKEKDAHHTLVPWSVLESDEDALACVALTRHTKSICIYDEA